MRLVTNDGIFLVGTPFELVAQLGARVRIPVRASREEDRVEMLLQLECDRVARYLAEIGPRFAEFASERLLADLEAEGVILVTR